MATTASPGSLFKKERHPRKVPQDVLKAGSTLFINPERQSLRERPQLTVWDKYRWR